MKGDIIIPISIHRTHNRNRSLSFINSDQLVNVNKGSRQIKPVTLGKRLALMIGYQGLLVLLSTAWDLVVEQSAKSLWESILETCWGQL
jgi:hypothetical protein